VDSATDQLPGAILSALIVGVLLSLPLSLLLRRLYSREVLASMRTSASGTLLPGHSTITPTQPAALRPRMPLQLRLTAAEEAQPGEGSALLRRARTGPWVGLIPYALAGVAYAIVATLAVLWSDDLEILPGRMLILTLIWSWPVVLTAMTTAAADWGQRAALVLAYFALLLLLSPASNADTVTVWALSVGIPTLALAPFLTHRLRAMGPLVLMVTLPAAIGLMLGFQVPGTVDKEGTVLSAPALTAGLLLTVTVVMVVLALRRDLLPLGLAAFTLVGLEGLLLVVGLQQEGGALLSPLFQNVVLLMTLAVVVATWLATLAARALGNSYRAQTVSDQLVAADTQWLIFSYSLFLQLLVSDDPFVAVPFTLVAFVAFRATLWLACRPLSQGAWERQESRLLLLRVFGDSGRSERLMRGIGRNWRHIGSIQLIAGPDLALANLEPHEFIDFVSGRLSRAFITDGTDLRERMDQAHGRPDPDGRFRVNEFFCHDDTWRATLQALARSSDAVLMDLRAFSRERSGCIYELGQLLELVPLRHITLLVDRTTDHQLLASTLHDSWRTIDAASPNLADPAPTVQILSTSGAGRRSINGTLAVMCSGIEPSS
jgi:hypothetical protein